LFTHGEGNHGKYFKADFWRRNCVDSLKALDLNCRIREADVEARLLDVRLTAKSGHA
jgi:hypothetical protein